MIESKLTPKSLKQWRIKRGWSVSYVANRIGMTYAYLWGRENSDKNVPLITALALAAIDKDLEPLT